MAASARRLSFVAIAIVAIGCHRRKEPPRVVAGDGESAVLPRVARPAGNKPIVDMRTIDARRYLLVRPANLSRTGYPLVLVFHGDGGDAASFHDAWPFEHASGDDAIVAYGDGRARTWDLETTRDNADEAYAVALVDAIATAFPIDRGRVFAAGYSSGGFFANVLACRRPGLLRAIASNAGGAPYAELEKWPNGYPKCPGQKPVAMLALHGENDSGVTLDSGAFSAAYWAYVDGCKTDEMETTGYDECRIYRGCPDGKAVGFCSIPTLGHWVWNHAAEASWTFFDRMSR